METKIAAVGDRAGILGFRAVGFDVFEAPGGSFPKQLISELSGRGYGIIFVTEDLAAADPQWAKQYSTAVLPAVIPVPGRGGSRGSGMAEIHRNVERAVGADIFAGK